MRREREVQRAAQRAVERGERGGLGSGVGWGRPMRGMYRGWGGGLLGAWVVPGVGCGGTIAAR